jgi:hypothetical protein
MLLFIIAIILSIYFLFVYFSQKKVPNNTVIAFTGGLGSGKTFLGVKYAIKHHKKMRMMYRLGIIKTKPLFYSNIPIRYERKSWAFILEYDHLTLKSRIPEYSTIFIDELGQFASQYDYQNPYVMMYLQEFIRFYRHYTDGKLIITDQTSSNIVVAIRRRINQIYNLHDFKRFFGFWYIVKVNEILLTEDIMNIKQTDQDDEPYFMGYLPFKHLKLLNYLNPFYLKKYDSRTYSINYKAKQQINFNLWEQYKTDYFIELPNIGDLKKKYLKEGFVSRIEMDQALDNYKKATATTDIQPDSEITIN